MARVSRGPACRASQCGRRVSASAEQGMLTGPASFCDLRPSALNLRARPVSTLYKWMNLSGLRAHGGGV